MENTLGRRGATKPNPAEASAHFRTKFAKSVGACGSMRKHAEAYGNPTENSVAEACGSPAEAVRKHAEGYGSHAEVMRKI